MAGEDEEDEADGEDEEDEADKEDEEDEADEEDEEDEADEEDEEAEADEADEEDEAGEEDDRQLFFHRRRMKSMQSSEKNAPTWPSKPPATAAESRKPVGTACNYKATKN